MATVYFLYRSSKEKGFLEARLQHLNLIWHSKSKIQVSKYFWETLRKSNSRDIAIKKEQKRILDECTALEDYILKELYKTDPDTLPKDWLRSLLNPSASKSATIPSTLIDYIDYYVKDTKSNKRTESSDKRFNVIKNKLIRMEAHRGHPIMIKEIGIDFKKEFDAYCTLHNYSQNTIQRDFVFIKTFCVSAKSKGLETSPDLESKDFKIKKGKVQKIYLTLKELETIEKLEGLNYTLSSVRDWLIISAFSAQRVSDFMRFNSKMITYEGDDVFLTFEQQKTGLSIQIPLLPKVLEILAKNDGKFPNRMSDQKYNQYLKQLCELAGITELVEGSKLVKVGKDYRRVTGMYRKCDLVCSHVGRRSFCSNYYGVIPTPLLMSMSGHSTEQQFQAYCVQPPMEKARQLSEYFKTL